MGKIHNPSFEDGWIDLLSSPTTTNQQPANWGLFWLKPGDALWDSDDIAMNVPECVHKLSIQLPSSEQLGGPDALILDGDTVYKMFSSGAFGAELRQVVTGLEPDSVAQVCVPIQIHRHDDGDPYGAEVGLWLNGDGGWIRPFDKEWGILSVWGVTDANGVLDVIIRVKSKWASRKDFFIDNLTWNFLPATEEPPPEPPEPEAIMSVTLFADGTGKWEAL